MTWWLTKVGALVFAIWFLRGLWVATQRPRLKVLSHEDLGKDGIFVTVMRQQLLPPWLSVRETWLVPDSRENCPMRESDGLTVQPNEGLGLKLHSAVHAAQVREKQMKDMMR
jgi:hypothetical protein